MSRLQDVLDRACADGAAPFLIAATGRGGAALWQGAAGLTTPGEAATPDTVLRFYSMTKAVAATAAMILVERGQLTPDTPVGDVLPAFDALQVLDGWDGDVPRLRAARRRATVRHLATHTAGPVYALWDADMQRFRTLTGLPAPTSGLLVALEAPLMFDPGSRWGYGLGSDWLGRVVEAIDGRRIDAFCQTEIFGPLGMASTGFDRPTALAQAFARSDDGFRPVAMAPPLEPEFYGMGHALYGTVPDYLRFLRMLLGGGLLDGVRVLSAVTVDKLLADHTGGLTIAPMITTTPAVTESVDLFPGLPLSHSLLALRVEADVPGRRSAGSQGWAGILNTHFWLDPVRDRAGVFATQLLPFADRRFLEAYAGFERAVYD